MMNTTITTPSRTGTIANSRLRMYFCTVYAILGILGACAARVLFTVFGTPCGRRGLRPLLSPAVCSRSVARYV